MKMDIISREKKVSEPPFRNFWRGTKEKQFKMASHAISHLARKHPRRLLSDILAEWTVNHKSTAFDEVCNMLNNYYIIQFLISVHLFRKRDLQSPLRNAGYVWRWNYWKFVLRIKETPFLKTRNSKISRDPPRKERFRCSIANLPSHIHLEPL